MFLSKRLEVNEENELILKKDKSLKFQIVKEEKLVLPGFFFITIIIYLELSDISNEFETISSNSWDESDTPKFSL